MAHQTTWTYPTLVIVSYILSCSFTCCAIYHLTLWTHLSMSANTPIPSRRSLSQYLPVSSSYYSKSGHPHKPNSPRSICPQRQNMNCPPVRQVQYSHFDFPRKMDSRQCSTGPFLSVTISTPKSAINVYITFGTQSPSNNKFNRQSSYLTTLTPHIRPRAKSDGHSTQRPRPCTLLSALEDKTAADPSDSVTLQPPLPAQQPKHRVRARTPPSDSESEVITGHVLASGRFKCSDPKCDNLRFGRQADFRRHHINVHALKKKEYFCTVEGCDRSRRPSRKSKGRSFGARKDKMKEHVQTVHFKESKKRKRSSGTAADDQDESDEDSGPESKTSL
ncbi:uncharacterized protein EKO05_0000466 [Ascochyta rabiei]|uniref:uncharacterized protein n=1 Tax=Didymella rabiei TaxID=5454 RepID=UPI00220F8EFA|nr:uncharacterized protein EKO05_0000466 [Ascochyta rabiei]UPX09783.1 hypothetical protein EKO05_0000466 [Ascochyta rabiei]